MSRWRRLLAASIVALLWIPSSAALAQELLTNGGIELQSELVAGRNAVPPGWQMLEGPKVPELPGPYRGDYNNSGVTQIPCVGFKCYAVDAADYTVWRNNLGTNFAMPNRHPSLTGPINQFDYDVWKADYGNPTS